MQKKALLALMLALALVLSGCALVKKDLAVDAATEIIKYKDQVVTKGEIQNQVNYQLNYNAYVYSMYGMQYDPTSEKSISDARKAVIDAYKAQLVSNAKIQELGLDQLTEEEEKQIEENAEKDYQDNLKSIKDSNYANSELSEEEIETKAKADLEARGYTIEEARKAAKAELENDKLRKYIIDPVTVSDEEIQKEYDSELETAKTSYAENASAAASALNNGTEIYFTPEGLRRVKQILVQYDEEHRTAISDAQAKVKAAQAILDDEEATDEDKATAKTDLEAAQADVDRLTEEAYASIDAEADEVLAKIEAGEDWDALTETYNDDPGMKSGRATAETGYAVCEGMTSFDSAFVEAAMGLANIGDVTGKIRGSSNGYYIIKYIGDVTAGEIGLDTVRDEIHDSLLSDKQDSLYEETIQKWVDEAEKDFKVDTGALN